MAFQPSDTLRNRTFWGLIIAQFLASFNDQAIHAAAMFYAINTKILTEAQAISLMPILFYAPWAIFVTLAGYLADRYSKTWALIIWKLAEVAIVLAALFGFYLGTVHGNPLGAWIVLATVFFMGTHAAFFAPAKYGAMPEILQPHVLSRGNGILESTTFLAAILGTVSGGLLSFIFRQNEVWIGVILLVLALIGAAASLMIAYLPPGNPLRAFPINLFRPLINNLAVLLRSRPLALSVLGIAFFIFMVSYMRATMYMHGQTRNPRWDEFTTSLVVATVALGVGLGSPLAGFLSGGKVELGLVPLGTLGMTFALLVSALVMDWTAGLIVSLVIIGFFSGFYMVPLYTLLQHRAPKASKGDLIATSNFINVTGAIAASLLFYILVLGVQVLGITPLVEQEDRIATGTLQKIREDEKTHRIIEVTVKPDKRPPVSFRAKKVGEQQSVGGLIQDMAEEVQVIEFDDNLFEVMGGGLQQGDEVIISRYTLSDPRGREVTHYYVRRSDQPLRPVYNNQGLPRYLFIGAGLMTLGILLLLVRKLPDFFVRSLFWMRNLRRYRIKVEGTHNLPTLGPVILATNCDRLEKNLQLVAATDRYTRFVFREDDLDHETGPLLRRLARDASLIPLAGRQASNGDWEKTLEEAGRALEEGTVVAVPVDGESVPGELDKFLLDLRLRCAAPVLPVYCGPVVNPRAEHLGLGRWIHVAFGQPLPLDAGPEDIRRRINELKDGAVAGAADAVAAH